MRRYLNYIKYRFKFIFESLSEQVPKCSLPRLVRTMRIAYAKRNNRPFIAKIKPIGIKMVIHPEMFTPYIYKLGNYEIGVVRYLEKRLRPGMNCIDIGANVGFFSLFMAECVTDSGRVFAFEPGDDAFKVLEENIRLNCLSNIKAENIAIGEKEGETIFYEGPPGFDVYNSVAKVTHPCAPGEQFIAKKVHMVRLDDYIEENGIDSVHFIKLDVEGYELFALKGMEKTLKENPALELLIELADVTTKNLGYSPNDTGTWLLERGWDIGFISRTGSVKPFNLGQVYNGEMLTARFPKR